LPPPGKLLQRLGIATVGGLSVQLSSTVTVASLLSQLSQFLQRLSVPQVRGLSVHPCSVLVAAPVVGL
jgi:hypothetical protein